MSTDLIDVARSILLAPYEDRPGADDGDTYRDAEDKRHERIAEKRATLSAEALRGEGYFWRSGGYDNESTLIEAIRRAHIGIGLTDAERWSVIQSAMFGCIASYVESEAEE